jgi:hypothetical protein
MAESPPATGRPKVLVKPLPIVFGAIAGLGIAVLLQQYGLALLTLPFLLLMLLVGGVVIGIGLPTLLLHTLRPKPVPTSDEEADS